MSPALGVQNVRTSSQSSVSQALPKMDRLDSVLDQPCEKSFGFRIEGPKLLIGPERKTGLRLATSGLHREKAWRLAHHLYRHKNYTRSRGPGLLYGPHDAHPRTTTFLAERDGRATAAVTLLFDSSMRLPADEIFGDELDALRSEGRHISELVSLVCRDRDQISAETIRWLFKLAYFTAFCLERATDFLITVNPKHVAYYEKFLLFERLGDVKLAPKVNGAEAILLRLNLQTAQARYRTRYERFPAHRNLYRYFMHRGDEVLGWLKRWRRPLEARDLARYFSRPHSEQVRPSLSCLHPPSAVESQALGLQKPAHNM